MIPQCVSYHSTILHLTAVGN